ncbi:MAG: PEGA domain-containing protein [Lentisphaeria bacterium]|nr:PEGA domain-containing protein [Lentisphaeria bacterium]
MIKRNVFLLVLSFSFFLNANPALELYKDNDVDNPTYVSQIIIESEPVGATVFINGKRVGKTPYIIPQKNKAPKIKVRLEQKGFKENTFELNRPWTKSLLKVKMELLDNFYYFQSKPEGASVRTDKQLLGETPLLISKAALNNVDEIYFSKIGYLSSSVATVNLAETPNYFSELKSNLAILTAVVYPEDAGLYVNGKKIPPSGKIEGKFTAQKYIINTMPEGEYLIHAAKNNVLSKRNKVALEIGKTVQLSLFVWFPTHMLEFDESKPMQPIMVVHENSTGLTIMKKNGKFSTISYNKIIRTKHLQPSEAIKIGREYSLKLQ